MSRDQELLQEHNKVKRLNRLLRRQGEGIVVRLCRPGSGWLFHNLGRAYAVDASTRFVTATHINLDRWIEEAQHELQHRPAT